MRAEAHMQHHLKHVDCQLSYPGQHQIWMTLLVVCLAGGAPDQEEQEVPHVQ